MSRVPVRRSKMTRELWVELYGLCYGDAQDRTRTVPDICQDYDISYAYLRRMKPVIEGWLKEGANG